MDDVHGCAAGRVGDQGLLDDRVEGGRPERVDERDPAIEGGRRDGLHRYQALPGSTGTSVGRIARKGAMSIAGSVPHTRSATRRPVVGTGAVPEHVPSRDDQVVEPRRVVDDRQAVGGHRQDPGPRSGELGALQRGERGRHPLGDKRYPGQVRLPIEAREVHRDAEKVRAVCRLAGGFEQCQPEPVLEVGREQLLPVRGEVAEERVLLGCRWPVHDDIEARRLRLGLDDLEAHRVDRQVDPELRREVRAPGAAGEDDVAGGDRTDVGLHARDPAAVGLERPGGRALDDPGACPLGGGRERPHVASRIDLGVERAIRRAQDRLRQDRRHGPGLVPIEQPHRDAVRRAALDELAHHRALGLGS